MASGPLAVPTLLQAAPAPLSATQVWQMFLNCFAEFVGGRCTTRMLELVGLDATADSCVQEAL